MLDGIGQEIKTGSVRSGGSANPGRQVTDSVGKRLPSRGGGGCAGGFVGGIIDGITQELDKADVGGKISEAITGVIGDSTYKPINSITIAGSAP
jgi:hypothetical protein